MIHTSSAFILQGLSIRQEQLVSSHEQLEVVVGERQEISVLSVQPVSEFTSRKSHHMELT